MKPPIRPLTLACALASSFIACGEPPKIETAAPAVSREAELEAKASVESTAAEAARITPFGVPECDNYVKKFLACVDGKVSGEQRENLMAAFEANRTKWRAMATMREGALALSLACKTAAQKSKEELAVDYGCEF